jgi:hypothetical protein
MFEHIVIAAVSLWIGLAISGTRADVVWDGYPSSHDIDTHEMIEFDNEYNRRDKNNCPTCPICYDRY